MQGSVAAASFLARHLAYIALPIQCQVNKDEGRGPALPTFPAVPPPQTETFPSAAATPAPLAEVFQTAEPFHLNIRDSFRSGVRDSSSLPSERLFRQNISPLHPNALTFTVGPFAHTARTTPPLTAPSTSTAGVPLAHPEPVKQSARIPHACTPEGLPPAELHRAFHLPQPGPANFERNLSPREQSASPAC